MTPRLSRLLIALLFLIQASSAFAAEAPVAGFSRIERGTAQSEVEKKLGTPRKKEGDSWVYGPLKGARSVVAKWKGGKLDSLSVQYDEGIAPQALIPGDRALVIVEAQPQGDFLGPEKMIGDPVTGEVWELNDSRVRAYYRMAPWKADSKPAPRDEVLSRLEKGAR